MGEDLPNEDAEFFDQHRRKVEEIFKDLTEQKLIALGIHSLQVIAEKSLDPSFNLIYMDGGSEILKGYQEMADKLEELENK